MTRALPRAVRNTALSFSALLLATTSFTGCYTQLKDSGDRYGYTGRYREPQPVHSDTIRKVAPPVQQATPAPEPPKTIAKTYDTVMRGDTMFIEERTREMYAQNQSQPVNSSETIINNYYGGYEPYDDYWWHTSRPRIVIALTFGHPYSYWYPRHYWHSYYSPWYDYGYAPSWWYGPSYTAYDPWYGGWYDPWYGRGFYPPLYDAYSPYYPYGGYYGGRHGYYDYGRGSYAGIRTGRVPNYGRFNSGERHGLVVSGTNAAPANAAPRLASPSNVVTNNAQVAGQGQVVTRNVPVHVAPPSGTVDRDGSARVADPNNGMVVERSGGLIPTETNARTVQSDPSARVEAPSQNAQVATPQKQIVIVRRQLPQANSGSSSVQSSAATRETASQPRAETGTESRASSPRYEAPQERSSPASRPVETNRTDTRANRDESRSAPARGVNSSNDSGNDRRSNDRGSSDNHSNSNDGPRRSR